MIRIKIVDERCPSREDFVLLEKGKLWGVTYERRLTRAVCPAVGEGAEWNVGKMSSYHVSSQPAAELDDSLHDTLYLALSNTHRPDY